MRGGRIFVGPRRYTGSSIQDLGAPWRPCFRYGKARGAPAPRPLLLSFKPPRVQLPFLNSHNATGYGDLECTQGIIVTSVAFKDVVMIDLLPPLRLIAFQDEAENCSESSLQAGVSPQIRL